MMVKSTLILLLLTVLTHSTFAERLIPIDIFINIDKKVDTTDFGQIKIIIKYPDTSFAPDTLDTNKRFRSFNILRFKSAVVHLNVNYGDRQSGFTRILDKKGKIHYELGYNGDSTKKYILFAMIKDKFKYQDFFRLDLSDRMGSEIDIHHKDWNTGKHLSVVLSSSKLLDKFTIFQHGLPNTYKDFWFKYNNDTLVGIWHANENEEDLIEKRETYIKTIVREKISNNKKTTFLDFRDLVFYFEDSEDFILEKEYQIRSIQTENTIYEFN
jgi:hypothetical protein